MKKSTTKFASSLTAFASVAGVVAPVAASADTTEAMTVEKAKALVEEAKSKKLFADYNIAYAAVLQLPKADQTALLGELAPLWEVVVTDDIKESLKLIEALSKSMDLGAYYDALTYVQKNVKEPRNVQYLEGAEIAVWGHKGVFTDDVVAATDAVSKAWTDKTQANITAAKDAIAKVKNADNVKWLNTEVTSILSKMEVSIAETKLTAKDTVEVTFSRALDKDLAVADITSKKGTTPMEVKSVTMSADKTKATVVMAAKFAEAEYSYDIKVGEKTLSTKVAAKEAKVNKVEFITSSAVMTDYTTAQDKNGRRTLTTKIKIYDQYGNDITENVNEGDLNISASNGTKKKYDKSTGTITIGLPETALDYEVGKTVTVTVVHKPTSVVGTSSLTIAQQQDVKTIELGNVTTDDSELKKSDKIYGDNIEDYYIPIVAKDANGNLLNKEDLQKFTITTSNSSVTDVNFNKNNKDGKSTPVEENEAGDPVIKLRGAADGVEQQYGQVTINIISETGVNGTKTFNVVKKSKIDKVTLDSPSQAFVYGKTISLPFKAYDVDGNEITKMSDLDGYTAQQSGNVVKLGTPTGSNDNYAQITATNATIQVTHDYANNTVGLEITPDEDAKPDSNAGTTFDAYLTVVTGTGYNQNLTISIQEDTGVEKVTGIDSGFLKTIQVGAQVEIKNSTFKFEDGYSSAVYLDYLGDETIAESAKKDGYTIEPTSGSDYVVVDKASKAGKLYFTAKTKGTQSFKVTAYDKKGNKAGDYSFSIQAVNTDDIDGYQIKKIDKLFTGKIDDVNSAKLQKYKDGSEIEVQGLKDGKVVQIKQTDVKSISVGDGLDSKTPYENATGTTVVSEEVVKAPTAPSITSPTAIDAPKLPTTVTAPVVVADPGAAITAPDVVAVPTVEATDAEKAAYETYKVKLAEYKAYTAAKTAFDTYTAAKTAYETYTKALKAYTDNTDDTKKAALQTAMEDARTAYWAVGADTNYNAYVTAKAKYDKNAALITEYAKYQAVLDNYKAGTATKSDVDTAKAAYLAYQDSNFAAVNTKYTDYTTAKAAYDKAPTDAVAKIDMENAKAAYQAAYKAAYGTDPVTPASSTGTVVIGDADYQKNGKKGSIVPLFPADTTDEAIDTSDADKTTKVTVVVNTVSGVKVVSQDLTYSSAKPKAASVKLMRQKLSTTGAQKDFKYSDETISTSTISLKASEVGQLYFDVRDQYNKKVAACTSNDTVKYTVTVNNTQNNDILVINPSSDYVTIDSSKVKSGDSIVIVVTTGNSEALATKTINVQ